MTTNKLITKSIFILVVFLIAGVTSSGTSKQPEKYSDKWCHKFNYDGSCCLVCSTRCYMNKYGKCQPVSDNCQQWDPCTGLCTCCYPGWGAPVNGVCNGPEVCTPPAPEPTPKPTVEKTDKYCLEYQWIGANKRIYTSWVQGCKKVCKRCCTGYYLDCDNICAQLPKNCLEAKSDGTCTCCKSGYELCEGQCVKIVRKLRK